MNDLRRDLLNEFGEQLVTNVRDDACAYLQRLISGKMRDKSSAAEFRKYQVLDAEAAIVVQRLMLIAIDACLVRFLQFLESSEAELMFRSSKHFRVDVCSLSDGLVGEVHGENGWLARFSKFKDSIEPIA